MRALHLLVPGAIIVCWPSSAPTVHGATMPADIAGFDLAQHTCAMYVAVRSRAFDASIAFGRDLQSIDLHWNMCPGGTMVACATAAAPGGGTVVTGIPWPYGHRLE